MDFDLSPDQLALQDAAADLLGRECTSERVRAAVDGYDTALWASMVDQGWLAIAVPESAGGLGYGTVEAAVLLEQTGRHLAPVPFLQQLVAIAALVDTDRLPALLAGETIGTVAHRSVEAHPDGTVSGRPEPVIFGATADVLVVPAGESLVAVDLAGIERGAEPAMDQTRELAWIELDHAPASVVGGPDAVVAHRRRGAVFHAAEMLGCAHAVMDLAVAYAKERHQFGRPIGSFQAVKHRCADMLVDVEGMRSAVYHAAWAVGADDPEADIAAATAKIWCSDAGVRVAESALQVHGGIGFTWESDVHLHLKRAQLDQVSFGDARHHRRALATMLAARYESGGSVLT